MNPQSIECDCGCWNIVVKVVPPGETCPCGDPRPHETCKAFPKRRPCEGGLLTEESPKVKYNVFQFERCADCGMLHPAHGCCPVRGMRPVNAVPDTCSGTMIRPLITESSQNTPPKPKPRNVLYRVASARPKGQDGLAPLRRPSPVCMPAGPGGRCEYATPSRYTTSNIPGCQGAGPGAAGGCAMKKQPTVIIPHYGCRAESRQQNAIPAQYQSSGGCPKHLNFPIAWCQANG